MNIEQILVLYFYKNRTLNLEHIGILKIADDVVIPEDFEKEFEWPENAISFKYDPKVEKEEQFIDFFSKTSKKIKPLASSDAESFFSLNRQFLNLGKVFELQGIGSIEMSTQGIYEFVQGKALVQKEEITPETKPEMEEKEISFRTLPRVQNQRGRGLLILVLAIIIALGSAAIYYFAFKPGSDAEKTDAPAAASGVVKPATVPDSTIKKTETILNPNSFKVVIRTYPTESQATKSKLRFESFGHKILIQEAQGTYLLVVPFERPLTDTTQALDSLKKVFAFPTYIAQ